MNISTHIMPATTTGPETADIIIRCAETGQTAAVQVQWGELRDRCSSPVGASLDAVLFAGLVYCADKMVGRGWPNTDDNWTRELTLAVPVGNPTLWGQEQARLEAALSFLTGDLWHLDFTPLTGPLYRERVLVRPRRRPAPQRVGGDVACLLSGGLDSLIGAVDWLEENPRGKLLAVGHHDHHVGGPFGDQNRLIRLLERHYPGRVDALQVQVGQRPAGQERSYRSRSLLFLALGLHAAQSLGPAVPLLVPENGTIAINLPLTPSRRGSCSTRTTHPLFLDLVRSALVPLGIGSPILNPLLDRTKGECVSLCRNRAVLTEATPLTVSCAKAGHKSTWLDKHASSCGRCVPCVFRRASLHVIGLDTEWYGRDICTGEVDIDHGGDYANDFRAVADFLRRRQTPEDIAGILLGSGGLPRVDLDHYSQLIHRAMNEVRVLLTQKGSDEVRRWIA